MWGYSESRCQKVNEKLSIVFCWGIKIFRVGDVFFSFLPAAEVEHKTTGLHGLACLVQVWLDFIWKIRKSLSSYPNKHHLALSFTVQKWRWLPRATLRSKFNCPIIVRVLPTNIFFSWKKYTFFFFLPYLGFWKWIRGKSIVELYLDWRTHLCKYIPH